MSSLDYWHDRIEEACRTGVVLIKEHTRHVYGSRAISEDRVTAKPLSNEERNEILRLNTEGKGWKEICSATGRGKTTVYRVLKENGRV